MHFDPTVFGIVQLFCVGCVLLVHAVAAVLVWMSRVVASHSALGVGDRARGYAAGALLHFACPAESLSYLVFHSGSVSLIQASIESQWLMILILIITSLSLIHGSLHHKQVIRHILSSIIDCWVCVLIHKLLL